MLDDHLGEELVGEVTVLLRKEFIRTARGVEPLQLLHEIHELFLGGQLFPSLPGEVECQDLAPEVEECLLVRCLVFGRGHRDFDPHFFLSFFPLTFVDLSQQDLP